MILDRFNMEKFPEWLEIARNEGAIALVDKDRDWTSFDVVAKLRNMLKFKKAGHAGTLDPLATGLLILGFGRGTKRMSEFQNMPKEYHTVIRLGATTITYDTEAEEENFKDFDHLSDDEIEKAAGEFTGSIMQVPPEYSAKKVKGKRAYREARKNKPVELEPQQVEVHGIEITDITLPFVTMTIKCSKGTYIRAIARDIGEKLGVGGYLAALRRTKSGDYDVATALTIDQFAEIAKEHKEIIGTRKQ